VLGGRRRPLPKVIGYKCCLNKQRVPIDERDRLQRGMHYPKKLQTQKAIRKKQLDSTQKRKREKGKKGEFEVFRARAVHVPRFMGRGGKGAVCKFKTLEKCFRKMVENGHGPGLRTTNKSGIQNTKQSLASRGWALFWL